MADSDPEWSDDCMYGSERNNWETCEHCFQESPAMWEAGAVLCQLGRKEGEVRISGKPKLVAARGAYCNGFMGLWIYSKDGELGRFDIEDISDHETNFLFEHIFRTWMDQENSAIILRTG